MMQHLIHHAQQNVWCSPDQDYQYLYQPVRLTRSYGVRQYVDVEWDRHWLPEKEGRYHVYQLGQVAPWLLNLFSCEQGWCSFSEVMNQHNLTLDAYVLKGVQLPRFESFFLRTRSRNLLVAVKDQPKICDLGAEPLYLRFYSNAYFGSERSHPTEDRVYTEGVVSSDRRSVVVFKQRIETLRANWSGAVYQFHNGWQVDTIRPDDVGRNDVLEFVQDTSIKDVFDIAVKDLHTFNSTLDRKRKYLVHRPKGITETIDYHDDIDVWLVEKQGARERGLFYHKAVPEAVRMVTHQDLSVPVETVVNHAQRVKEWLDPMGLFLRFRVRRSGYHRPLIYEHGRISELYKLNTDDDIVRSMVGTHATLSEWQAAELENSCYTRAMRAYGQDLTSALVQCAYGYHGAAHVIANTPQNVSTLPSGERGVAPPWALRTNSTFYEYDRKGRLIEGHVCTNSPVYQCQSELCWQVEGLVGRGSEYGLTDYQCYATPMQPNVGYRPYLCNVKGGLPDYQWREAVVGEDYTTSNGDLIWLTQKDEHFTAVRKDSHFLSYSLDVKPHGGLLRFTIESDDKVNGDLTHGPCHLPYGRLDLFLNGHSMIENLDYFVQWPEVVVCNKEFLGPQQTTQRITVRAYGFLDRDAKRLSVAEFGFLKHGLLSVNNRYNLREGKVLRIIADGKLWSRDEIHTAEDDWGIAMGAVRNGAPYLVTDIPVPMHDLVDTDVRGYREEAEDVDRRVEDYLTLYRPEPEPDGVDLIPRRYSIYSPFLSKIHSDLKSGYLYPEEIKVQYSDEDVREWLRGYEWLLGYDPIVQGVDDNYVSVHPHELFVETTLDVYQYNFLNRIIDVYLEGRVNLSTHVRIKEGWI